VPDAELAPRPVAEPAHLARVVAEAAAREHRIQRPRIAFQARGSRPDDLRGRERQRMPEQQGVELIQLVRPVGRAPLANGAGSRAAEVAVEMRPDLVTVAIAGR